MEQEDLKEMNNLAIQWRGEYLHSIALMERVIDTYISDILCSSEDKRMSIRHIILGDNRISLDNKRSIFKALAEKYHKEWYESYKNLNNNIKDIIENRNILAHCTLGLEKSEKKRELVFVRYKDGEKRFLYTEEKFSSLINEMGNITGFIYVKIKELKITK